MHPSISYFGTSNLLKSTGFTKLLDWILIESLKSQVFITMTFQQSIAQYNIAFLQSGLINVLLITNEDDSETLFQDFNLNAHTKQDGRLKMHFSVSFIYKFCILLLNYEYRIIRY